MALWWYARDDTDSFMADVPATMFAHVIHLIKEKAGDTELSLSYGDITQCKERCGHAKGLDTHQCAKNACIDDAQALTASHIGHRHLPFMCTLSRNDYKSSMCQAARSDDYKCWRGAPPEGGQFNYGKDTCKSFQFGSGAPSAVAVKNGQKSAEEFTECEQGGPEWLRTHPNKAAARVVYLRLCKPCATTCQVRKECMPRGFRISHWAADMGRVYWTVPFPSGADLKTVALQLQKVATEPLCGNF